MKDFSLLEKYEEFMEKLMENKEFKNDFEKLGKLAATSDDTKKITESFLLLVKKWGKKF